MSTQTTPLTFIELSDRHVLRCCRRHPGAYGVTGCSKIGLGSVAVTPSNGDGESSDSDAARTNTRMGPYRHWLSERTQGGGKCCAQPGLGSEYRNLTPSERERHTRGAADAGMQCLQVAGASINSAHFSTCGPSHIAEPATLRAAGGVNPGCSSAAMNVPTPQLSKSTDSDEGFTL